MREKQPWVVLLVEDDDFIREIVAEFLAESGHAVIQVADASQALEILRESAHKVDLLFTDVRMPGRIDGMQLAELVTAAWPEVKVLIASGHIRPSQAEIPVRSRFMPKPYTCSDMNRMIEALFSMPLLNNLPSLMGEHIARRGRD